MMIDGELYQMSSEAQKYFIIIIIFSRASLAHCKVTEAYAVFKVPMCRITTFLTLETPTANIMKLTLQTEVLSYSRIFSTASMLRSEQ